MQDQQVHERCQAVVRANAACPNRPAQAQGAMSTRVQPAQVLGAGPDSCRAGCVGLAATCSAQTVPARASVREAMRKRSTLGSAVFMYPSSKAACAQTHQPPCKMRFYLYPGTLCNSHAASLPARGGHA